MGGRDHSCEACGTGGFNSPHDPNCDGMTDAQASEAYMAALAELERNPWQERAEAAEQRVAELEAALKRLADVYIDYDTSMLAEDTRRVLKGEQAK